MTSRTIRRQLHREVSSPREARSVVRAALPDEQDSVRDIAVLLTNELVTNAVLHGVGEIGLALQRSNGRLRVEVADAECAVPVLQAPDAHSEHGRGVALVDVLASSWGVRDLAGDGKAVWFELSLEE
jgi:anti-sigma regulatory factor (Ser/Thr protein kinase)